MYCPRRASTCNFMVLENKTGSFRYYFNPVVCVCFAKKVYDHDAKYPFRDAAQSLNVCPPLPPWCVFADYYFRPRTNRCHCPSGRRTWYMVFEAVL